MRKKIPIVLFACTTFVFTAFVFANTYEVVFNRDVVFASSVRRMAAQQVINTAVSEFATKSSSNDESLNSKWVGLERFEVPAIKARMQLEEGRRINHSWYQRPSMTHYLGLNKDKYGTPVDYLFYTSKSWQSIPAPDRIEKGMEVNVYYKGGARSSFIVAEKKVLPLSQSLIINKAEDRQVLLIVEDAGAQAYYGFSLVLNK